VAGLVDTNLLVYRHDPYSPEKQTIAEEFLLQGIVSGTLRLPYQAIVEFYNAVTRPLPGTEPLLSPQEARRETEELLSEFKVLYPNETVVRTAVRGSAAYGLSWFDAHMWAYAEVFGLSHLFSEDFQHDRLYGTVRAVNPFVQ
jgi:predicted nucleic acid-binding protein